MIVGPKISEAIGFSEIDFLHVASAFQRADNVSVLEPKK
jgi:hypothetical protein